MRTLLTALMLAAAPALAQSNTAAPSTPPPPPPVASLDESPSPSEPPGRKIRIYMTDGQELNAMLLGES